MIQSFAGSLERLEEGIGELQAEHAGRRDLADFAKYQDDPIGFFRDVLKVEELWSKQEAIAYAVRDHAQVVAVGCNASGKDWVAARIALHHVFARGGFVSVTGPTERQVKQVCFGEIARAFKGSPELPGKLYELALKLDGRDHAGIVGYTATESSRATGVHAPKLLVVVTEGQGLEPWAYESIFANASGDDARILVLGNPLFVGGKFREYAQSPHWHTITMSALDHPNVVTGKNIIPGAITRAGVQRIEQEYGKDSAVYRSRVLAEFPVESAESLIRRGWLEASAHRWAQGSNVKVSGTSAVIGVDVARLGGDRTVMAIRHGMRLAHLITLPALDTMETAGRIITELESRGYRLRPRSVDAFPNKLERTDLVRVDEVGIGAGVLDRLRELRVNVEGFNGARSPVEGKSVVTNARAESYWGLRNLLEGSKIDLPADSEFADELAATEWMLNRQTGLVQIVAKEDTRAVLGRSPDKADAVTMAFYGVWEPVGEQWSMVRTRWA